MNSKEFRYFSTKPENNTSTRMITKMTQKKLSNTYYVQKLSQIASQRRNKRYSVGSEPKYNTKYHQTIKPSVSPSISLSIIYENRTLKMTHSLTLNRFMNSISLYVQITIYTRVQLGGLSQGGGGRWGHSPSSVLSFCSSSSLI